MYRRILTFGLVTLLSFTALGCKGFKGTLQDQTEKQFQKYSRDRMGPGKPYIKNGFAYCQIGVTTYESKVRLCPDERESLILAAEVAAGVSTYFLLRLDDGTIDTKKDGYITPEELYHCMRKHNIGAEIPMDSE
jgi:hypothetical protein|tara:strand:- start:522 stop:923 length:402 start_codon:yes stop_codon:yes gene_type:complete